MLRAAKCLAADMWILMLLTEDLAMLVTKSMRFVSIIGRTTKLCDWQKRTYFWKADLYERMVLGAREQHKSWCMCVNRVLMFIVTGVG